MARTLEKTGNLWVTRDHVHFDRTICPWLIRRFLDADARFGFIGWNGEPVPPGAIAFAIPGCDLPPHGDQDSTFSTMVAAFGLEDPVLADMATIVDQVVRWGMVGEKPDLDDELGRLCFGLIFLSDGLLMIAPSDEANIEASLHIYDALYAALKVRHLIARDDLSPPEFRQTGPTELVKFQKALLDEAV